ncbi:MAG: nitroreductase family protein [Clostridium sp.]
MHQRKSIRVFENCPISTQEQEAILLATATAPTAGNQQLYSILNITDPKLKKGFLSVATTSHLLLLLPLFLSFAPTVRNNSCTFRTLYSRLSWSFLDIPPNSSWNEKNRAARVLQINLVLMPDCAAIFFDDIEYN